VFLNTDSGDDVDCCYNIIIANIVFVVFVVTAVVVVVVVDDVVDVVAAFWPCGGFFFSCY